MRKFSLYYVLIFLGLFVIACSEDEKKDELIIPEGWQILARVMDSGGIEGIRNLLLHVVTSEGVDLLNPDSEERVDINKLTVYLNGEQLRVGLSEGYKEGINVSQKRWSLGIGWDLILSEETWYEIVFDWGENVEKDVLKFQIKRLGGLLIDQIWHNDKLIRRYDGLHVLIVK